MPSFIRTLLATMLASLAGAALAAPAASTAQPEKALNRLDYTGDVIYQIVTDRFRDGDPSNNPKGKLFSKDCVKTELYCGGDWQGIIDKIEDGYLTGMGVSAILISPPVQNVAGLISSQYSSYHGYWPLDMKRTNPAFGSIADFKRLLAVAHAHHIKVMIDFITNQSSPASEDDPDFAENGKLYDDGKLLSHFSDDDAGMYHHYGETNFSSLEDEIHKSLYNMADLDQQHPQIDRYLRQAVAFWLDTGIDGLRVDTVKHIATGWQRSWMDGIYSHQSLFTAGEWYVGREDAWGPSFDFANESGMSVLDFPLAQTVRDVFHYRSQDMSALERMIARTAKDYARPLDQISFIDNHDQNRFTMGDTPAQHRQTEQAIAFILTSRGTPMIYYGTEQYLLGPGHAPINRARMTSFATSTPLYGLIGRLAALRKANPALQFGSQEKRWLSTDVYVYERRFHGNSVLVAINKSTSATAHIANLHTSLPCARGRALQYADQLGQQFEGGAIRVGCDGSAAPFDLAPGAIAVWAAREADSAKAGPELGHVGPIMGRAGAEVVLSGRHFGTRRGSVLFGTTPAQILSWRDDSITVKAPLLAAGYYDLAVQRGALRSESYPRFELLSGPQLSLRVIVDDASAKPGEQVYLLGDIHELGSGQPGRALGPMFDKIVYRYPSWYLDVSVPASTTLSFRFLKKNAAGAVTWESGAAHTTVTPAEGTASVRVKLNGWSSAPAQP